MCIFLFPHSLPVAGQPSLLPNDHQAQCQGRLLARALHQRQRHSLLRTTPFSFAQLPALLLLYRRVGAGWVLLCAVYQRRKAAVDYVISFCFWGCLQES